MVTVFRILFFVLIIGYPNLCKAQPSGTILRTIGVETAEDSPHMFGHITGLALDESLNIYVLDRFSYEVRVFTWEGEYLRSIGRGRGAGPGEFMMPLGVSLGPDGTLYISDYEASRITLYSPDGEYVDQISGVIAYRPPSVLDNEHIFMARGALNFTQPCLLQYSRSGEILNEGVDPVFGGREIALSAATMVGHAPTPDGSIVVVRPYPYELFLLDKDLAVIQQWPGKDGLVDSPPKFTNQRGWQIEGKADDVTVGPTGRIFVSLRKGVADSRHTYLDVYSPDGVFETRILTSEFGVENLMFFVIGPGNVLVCNLVEPFPQVVLVDLSDFLEGDRR